MRGTDIWRLTFVASDCESPPVAHRIRSLLKHALRSLGLRCISVDGGPGKPEVTIPDEEQAMIRISTTTLEAFRKVIHEEHNATEEELIASVKGKPFLARWQMNAGKAWHSLLADPGVNVAGVPPVTDDQRHAMLGYRPEEGDDKRAVVFRERLASVQPVSRDGYAFSENAIALARHRLGEGVWEVKATKTLEVLGHPVTLVAQADHWRGLQLADAKATWSNPSMADYEPSLQWRTYLLCHGAESFSYHRFSFRDPKGAAKVCELREALTTTFWTYPELERDVTEWVTQFVAWASGKGLLPFLARESSTPVYEEAA